MAYHSTSCTHALELAALLLDLKDFLKAYQLVACDTSKEKS